MAEDHEEVQSCANHWLSRQKDAFIRVEYSFRKVLDRCPVCSKWCMPLLANQPKVMCRRLQLMLSQGGQRTHDAAFHAGRAHAWSSNCLERLEVITVHGKFPLPD
mmetsp:Transcript_54059/g.126277  ORF Transcript_54059/g.126277 Transcript_54059/m.126277 type:complete len:105 (-) Transcript_54059:39-353(-)